MSKLITKAAALDRFITDRMQGDVPLAIEEGDGRCVYNPKVHGGCAIGVMLAEAGVEYDPGWEGQSVTTLFREFPGLTSWFEDPHSPFWNILQQAHDSDPDWDNPISDYLRRALGYL
jgi:hypothetical protein